MVLVLGIIFLIFLIFLFDWIISSEKEIFKEKIRTVIVIFSILLSILFLFFGLYYFSTFFVSLAIWFFKRKVFFDLIMRLFKKKNNSSIPLSEAYDLLGIDENASIDNINKAHKELITRLHPDKGGSSYLSARINEARDIIMNEKMKRN
ncbi:MAG: hypothetical protein CNC74_01660 [alpha proteobacterium MED-G09]|nr:hypothetical protein [Rhodobiaceae bacterium]PDH51452.1 MAG: hypothetical protein CNC74_01660 [alpha proteobacterium MED-G09]|tara:strand:- start:19867 stop:20313 length:447 start_codon:yes stop_codon:yes gene_type:complete